MKLVLTDEQEELRATARRFFEERSPMSRVRELIDGDQGYDHDLWKQLAGQLGLTGLAIPERYGGSGFGYVELSVVLEEMGRALVPAPFLASAVLAATALLASDDEEARRELLPGIAGGDTIAALAVREAGGEDTVTATEDGSPRLSGRSGLVLDGAHADVIVVAATTTSGERALFCVSGQADGLTRTALTSADPTRSLARLDFDATPARRLGCADATSALARVAGIAAVALSAEQVGGLLRCVEMTVDYAKIRMQFGRPIGSFQAVKHTAADMRMDAELAYSALRYASWAADESPDELPVAASLAKSSCSAAYARVTAQTIQLHGGIGYTWEHDAHLYYKRARSTQVLFGDPDRHRALLADRLGI